MAGYVLAIDVGTTGIKAGVIDTAAGKIRGFAYQAYSVYRPQLGYAEQSVSDIWGNLCAVSREAIEACSLEIGRIEAVTVCNQRATFVPIGKDGKPLCNYITWQDIRSTKQYSHIRESIGCARFREITGSVLSMMPAISKILWLRDNLPSLYNQTWKFASMQDMILRQFGIPCPPMDYSDASAFGCFDVRNQVWAGELIDELGIDEELFPELSPSGTVVGRIGRKASEETSIPEGTPIVLGGGDTQCSAVGAGCIEEGQICINLGTGAGIVGLSTQPYISGDVELTCMSHVLNNVWDVEGASIAACSVYDWFIHNFYRHEIDRKETLREIHWLIEQEVAPIPAGSMGLLCLPTFMGAGSPYWYGGAAGVFLGWKPYHTRAAFARALLEGVAMDIRLTVEAFRGCGLPVREIRLTGGGSKSGLWVQIHADVLGNPILTPTVRDSTLMGAAILAALGVNLFSDIHDAVTSMVRLSGSYGPNQKASMQYERLSRIYGEVLEWLIRNEVFEKIPVLGISP